MIDCTSPFHVNDRSCYRELKYSSTEFRGKVFPACDIKKLYTDIVQELWKENRENVIEANGRIDGGIQGIRTKEPDKNHKRLDSEYTLNTGFIPRYFLQSLRSLLKEMNLADKLFVKYAEHPLSDIQA